MNRVSVIIPTYNSAHLLERCIASVLDQTRRPDEIWVIDDGSTDNTPELTERLCALLPGLIHVHRQENAGPGVARNLGIQMARGEWIAFLDADDRWLPTKLEEQLACAETHPAAGLIYSDASVIDSSGRHIANYLADKGPVSGWAFDRLLQSFFILPSTALVRRDALLCVGMFDTRLRKIEDYDLWLRLSQLYPFQLVPECLTLYQRQQTSSSKDNIAMTRTEIQVFRNLQRQKLTRAQRRAVRRRLARNLFDYSYEIRTRDRRASLDASWQAVRVLPSRPAHWKRLFATLASALPGRG